MVPGRKRSWRLFRLSIICFSNFFFPNTLEKQHGTGKCQLFNGNMLYKWRKWRVCVLQMLIPKESKQTCFQFDKSTLNFQDLVPRVPFVPWPDLVWRLDASRREFSSDFQFVFLEASKGVHSFMFQAPYPLGTWGLQLIFAFWMFWRVFGYVKSGSISQHFELVSEGIRCLGCRLRIGQKFFEKVWMFCNWSNRLGQISWASFNAEIFKDLIGNALEPYGWYHKLHCLLPLPGRTWPRSQRTAPARSAVVVDVVCKLLAVATFWDIESRQSCPWKMARHRGETLGDAVEGIKLT